MEYEANSCDVDVELKIYCDAECEAEREAECVAECETECEAECEAESWTAECEVGG